MLRIIKSHAGNFSRILLCTGLVLGLMAYAFTAQAATFNTPTAVPGDSFTISWSGARTYAVLHHQVNGIWQGLYGGSGSGSFSYQVTGKAPGTYAYKLDDCLVTGSQYGSSTSCSSITRTINVGNPTPSNHQFNSTDVQVFLNDAREEGRDMIDLLNDEIGARLSEANLVLDKKGLTYSTTLPDHQIRGGCTANVKAIRLNATAHISSDSEFKLMMESLSKPIVASIQLVGFVDLDGQIRTRLGARVLGKCIRYARMTIDAGAKTDFTIDTSVEVNLNPTKDTSQPGVLKIKLDPQLKLGGGLKVYTALSAKYDPKGGLYDVPLVSDIVGGTMNQLLKLLVSYGNDKVNSTISGQVNTAFNSYLATEQVKLQNKLRGSIPHEYVLPVSSQHENELLSFVSHYALNYLPPSDFLKAHAPDIIYSLLTGDEEMLKNKIATAAACNLSADIFSLNMNTMSRPSVFKTTTRSEFCSKVDNISWLGNAEPGISGYTGEEAWTLTPGTRFEMSTVSSIRNNYQPYTKRVHYRTINNITDGVRRVVSSSYSAAMSACYTQGQGYCYNPPNIENYTTYVPIPRGTGSCKLEMRIYKKDVAQTGLKPLLAIHGGAWKYRGAAFYGLESQISHFTEQGFVVFAPFYRLTGENDGNVECNNATGEDIVADIDAALQWVKNYRNTYGASNGKIRLFGQSAGAHLAAWLTTHKSADIQKALLMYPPTDAQDYIKEYKAFTDGSPYSLDYEGSFTGLGVSSLEAFFDAPKLETIDIYDSTVLSNSFPGIIANTPSAYPPVFAVHGKMDRLVPSIQSVRLCNAYSGNPNYGPASNSGTSTKQVYNCGPSRLHILEEADHMLELCLPPLRCEAGKSTAALDAARDSLAEARLWLSQ